MFIIKRDSNFESHFFVHPIRLLPQHHRHLRLLSLRSSSDRQKYHRCNRRLQHPLSLQEDIRFFLSGTTTTSSILSCFVVIFNSICKALYLLLLSKLYLLYELLQLQPFHSFSVFKRTTSE